MPASPLRAGRTPKSAPDAGTRQGMYVAFVKNAIAQKAKGDTQPYGELVAQLAGPAATPAARAAWLAALSHVAPALDRSCAELLDAVLDYPWLAAPPAVADAWVRFVCALVSARGEWVAQVAARVFANFGLHPAWYDEALVAADAPRPTRRALYDRLHALLQQLLRLVPTLAAALQGQVTRHFPHKRDRTLAQVLYVRNVLRVTAYCEALTEPIWAAVLDHVLQVDVEIQVELDELEEQGLAPAAAAPLAHVLDGRVDEAAAEEEDEVPDDGDGDGADDDASLDSLDDDDGYDVNDALLPTRAAAPTPAWGEVAVLAGKLDALMKVLFDFLAQHVGPDATDAGADARRYQLYQTLLGLFTRAVLPTFRSRHVQFVLFWYASLDAEFADMFLGTLLSKSLYAPQRDARAHAGPDAAAFLRIAAASYVASFVARAQYIDAPTTRTVVLNLCTYLDAGLEAFAQQGARAPAPGQREHALFYAVAQAVFYIFCFRWRDLRQAPSAADATLADDDGPASLAHTYPTACSFELSPQLMPTLHGTSFSSASSAGTSALHAEAGWAPGLAVVQRVITSPLNPLRYCNANVVQQFAHVAQHTGFLYCYSILDANARRAAPPHDTSAPGTPRRHGAAPRTRESTPLAAAPAEAPAPVAAPALDVFFPFDPYRLRDSGAAVHRLYREWSDVAPEGDDEEDDADEEDSADDDVDDEMGALPASRAKPAPLTARRGAHASSLDTSSITPESIAQSLEAMSISPYTG
ncbi:DNA independent RNA polymerase I transcription factor [Malassezia brasiliensis]|uniref:DNA independent RNA polymerase I transcription factor n=1 Tax=Malassezia brasiliensis TaxID=1821822 RepID=A0AAF0DWE1_9BASI|nr:DNA independent RNA polymerase I transcription factor [Malassezia brasiliensis]